MSVRGPSAGPVVLLFVALACTRCTSGRPGPRTVAEIRHIASAAELGVRSRWGLVEIERAVPALVERCLSHRWLARRAPRPGRRPTVAVLPLRNRLSEAVNGQLLVTALERQLSRSRQLALWKPTDDPPDLVLASKLVGTYRRRQALALKHDLLLLELDDAATGEVMWIGVDESRRLIEFDSPHGLAIKKVTMLPAADRTTVAEGGLSSHAARQLALAVADAVIARAASAPSPPVVRTTFGVRDRTGLALGLNTDFLLQLVRQRVVERGVMRLVVDEPIADLRLLREQPMATRLERELDVDFVLESWLALEGKDGARTIALHMQLIDLDDRRARWSVVARGTREARR